MGERDYPEGGRQPPSPAGCIVAGVTVTLTTADTARDRRRRKGSLETLVLAIDRLRPFEHPLGRLEAVTAARRELAVFEHESVQDARARGCSWGEIGRALGVTRQAARRRFN